METLKDLVTKQTEEVNQILSTTIGNARLTQRPLLVSVAQADKTQNALRDSGDKMGLVFEEKAPYKSILGPKDIQDHLAYSSASNVFPLPEFFDVTDGTKDISPENRKIVLDNVEVMRKSMEGHQQKVREESVKLFDIAAKNVLQMKNNLHFHL